MAIIELQNINFNYPSVEKLAIKDLSLTIHEGEFIVIAGASGSGKSTLLKILKPEIVPHGECSGTYLYKGISILDEKEYTNDIGYVFQDPENQMVADTVKSELVFGMENYGLSQKEMRIRLAEIVELFGLTNLLDREIHHLSGGQKQLVNLASIVLLQPDVILLDEPTAQLDPIAAKELFAFLQRLNEEFGITIILVEHRLDEAVSLADRLILMDDGEIQFADHPKEVLQKIWDSGNPVLRDFIPSLPHHYLLSNDEIKKMEQLPLTIKEATRLSNFVDFRGIEKDEAIGSRQVILECRKLHFQYEKKEKRIVENLNLTLYESSISTIFGNNGAGKSTLLKLIAGIYKSQLGTIYYKTTKVKELKKLRSSVGYLPQQPLYFFTQDTIQKELDFVKKSVGDSILKDSELIEKLHLHHILDKHPHDCSGGEIQKAAIACILLTNPEILLLDEPTKGLDPVVKHSLGKLLTEIKTIGTTILMVSHDIEFASMYSDECNLMFEGEIIAKESTQDFIRNNYFYTTVLERLRNRMTRMKK